MVDDEVLPPTIITAGHGHLGAGASAMRVVVETTALERPGADRGLGRYTRAVLEGAVDRGFDVMPLAVRNRHGRTAEFRDLLERQARIWHCKHDVFHATNPNVSVIRTAARKVVTILDTIPLDVPGYRQTGIKRSLFFALATKADRVLTLSDFSARRIATRLGVSPEKIVVAPLPPGPEFHPRGASEVTGLRARLGLEDRYFCGLADLRTPDPRKRSHWLPEIGHELSARGLQLVLAGAGTEAWDSYPGVRGIGRVDDASLAVLYSGAICYVGTSAYEGQGLPALEAMACGTPVVAMSNSSIPGVVGEGGVLVDEAAGLEVGRIDAVDVDGIRQIVDACLELAANEPMRKSFGLKARRSAGRFTLGRFAEGLARAYSGGSS